MKLMKLKRMSSKQFEEDEEDHTQLLKSKKKERGSSNRDLETKEDQNICL